MFLFSLYRISNKFLLDQFLLGLGFYLAVCIQVRWSRTLFYFLVHLLSFLFLTLVYFLSINTFSSGYETDYKPGFIRNFLIIEKTSWGWAKPSSVSSLVRTRLRFTAISKMDLNFLNGPEKIEIFKKIRSSSCEKS